MRPDHLPPTLSWDRGIQPSSSVKAAESTCSVLSGHPGSTAGFQASRTVTGKASAGGTQGPRRKVEPW